MGRRKDNNQASSSFNNLHHPQGSKIRFRDDDDDEALDEVTESSNLDESMCDLDGSVIGRDKATEDSTCDLDVSLIDSDDKTSADYYFDSYSHFGS